MERNSAPNDDGDVIAVREVPIPWKRSSYRSSSRPGEPGAFRRRLETRSHNAENASITMDLRRLDAFTTYCIVIEALAAA